LPPGEVLKTLSSDDLDELIYTEERKAPSGQESPDARHYGENIRALQRLREGAPLRSENPDVKTVFNLISDHYPIYVDLTV
ncbi:MAG TPA: hypothetical protein VLQ93_25220, partial [Myxococcaceae bacterium]|nr:hypothetical protein [Myxococcaceae bacterium]